MENSRKVQSWMVASVTKILYCNNRCKGYQVGLEDCPLLLQKPARNPTPVQHLNIFSQDYRDWHLEITRGCLYHRLCLLRDHKGQEVGPIRTKHSQLWILFSFSFCGSSMLLTPVPSNPFPASFNIRATLIGRGDNLFPPSLSQYTNLY